MSHVPSLRGGRLGLERKAIVLVVAGPSQVETFLAQALRATFPRHVAATHDVAQFVVDPDKTLESDEVPVTTSTHNGNMDATKADLRPLAKASEEVTTIDDKTSEPLSGDMDENTKKATRHVQIVEQTGSTIECSGHKKQKRTSKNKQISIPSRTKHNDSLKIGPCVKKARAPMSPKIACPCMRQLSEIEPKRTPHTEPPSVGSSAVDLWCKTCCLGVANPPRDIGDTRLQITTHAVPSEVPCLPSKNWLEQNGSKHRHTSQ